MGFCHPDGMAHTLLISGIRRKRALLAGEITKIARLLEHKRRDLAAVDQMLRLLDTNINPAKIKGIRPHLWMDGFCYGELTRVTYTVLRNAPHPMSARQIAEAAAKTKGIPFIPAMTSRALHNLTRLARVGRVCRSGKRRQLKWSLPSGGSGE